MSIRIDHISKSYKDKIVFDDFSMDLPAHGIVGLSGPSGCGKTTFLHILAGLIAYDSGSITGISGKRTGVVFQEDRLLPWLTAAENLDLVIKNQATTTKWLEEIQLSDHSDYYPSEMSGGMKRRISLARALAFDCDLLLLDEPFQGLDDVLKDNMQKLVLREAQSKPVLLVSHDSSELSELADQIYQADGKSFSLVNYHEKD